MMTVQTTAAERGSVIDDQTPEYQPNPALQDTLQTPVSPFDDSLEHDLVLARARAKLFGAPEPEAVTKIGRFAILRKLGQGGMGMVFAAYDEELDRRVAIKLLRQSDAHATDRSRREAQAMARLSHPNVAQIHEVGVWRGRVYLALEYIEGQTLSSWLARAQPTMPEIVAVLIQAGEGLSAAHEAGLVHRDFKPDNVMVGDDGRVRVLDFGLASVDREREAVELAAERSPSADATPLELKLTQTGALMGTPAYMSPEQLRGERSTIASDCFGFCVTAYEALFGERPFAGDTLAELRRAVSEETLRPVPRERRVPGPLHAALRSGLAATPGARPELRHLLAELAPYATQAGALPQAPDARAVEARTTLIAVATWIVVLAATLKLFPRHGTVAGYEGMYRWVATSTHTWVELLAADSLILALVGTTSTTVIGALSRRRLRRSDTARPWWKIVGLSWLWVGLTVTLCVLTLLRAWMYDYAWDPRPMLRNLSLLVWIVGLALSLPIGVAALERLSHPQSRLPRPLVAVATTLVIQLVVAVVLLALSAWAPMQIEPASVVVAVGLPGIVAAGVGSSLAFVRPSAR